MKKRLKNHRGVKTYVEYPSENAFDMFHALAKSKGYDQSPATKKPPAVRILSKEKIQTAGG